MCAVPKSVDFQWVSSRNAALRVDGFDVGAGEYDAGLMACTGEVYSNDGKKAISVQ